MIKKPVIWIITLILGGTILMGCGRRGHWNKSPEKKAEYITEKISDELDLNDSQKAKLDTIKNNILEKRKGNKSAREEVFNVVISELKKDSINENNINQVFVKHENDFKEMRKYMVEQLSEFHKILTPEQRTKLVQKLTKINERMNH